MKFFQIKAFVIIDNNNIIRFNNIIIIIFIINFFVNTLSLSSTVRRIYEAN